MSQEVKYYAQHGEDVTLLRYLGLGYTAENTQGFYVDVGAWEPELDSVTKHFYDHGWHGINIEPNPLYFTKLEAERPRDINVQIAIDNDIGQRKMTCFAGSGLSTLVPEFAAEGAKKFEPIEMSVHCAPLWAILEAHAPPKIDFMKIDVEGWEKHVIESNDWSRFRPRILVVESTKPMSNIEVHDEWEPTILAARYEFIEFDGLNRWYCRQGL